MAMFKFKQFDVDQTGCAMKINTDGVLLGALVSADNPQYILDIGAGTGVISLMLAQRFTGAKIDAVEIDAIAAQTTGSNFQNSRFATRLNIYPTSFQAYSQTYPERKYDLIVSNPPFYINSLTADNDKINLAKHAGQDFFKEIIETVALQLAADGICWLILPLETSALVKSLASQHALFIQQIIFTHSFAGSIAHREIIFLSRKQTNYSESRFVIYDAPKVYSQQYRNALKDFFVIF